MTATHTDAELLAKLQKAVNGARAVMVGVVGGAPHHFQPMKGHTVEGESQVWFICRRDITLVRDLEGETACGPDDPSSARDNHLHASVGGELTAERDQARIDQFWSSVADAWLPEGTDLTRGHPVAVRSG